MTLEAYEEEILEKMYDNRLIGGGYTSIEKVCSIIKWEQISKKYGIRKSCSKAIERLAKRGYVDLHGKSGDVASLTRFGVSYVLGKQKS
jgi:hypothetical protein